MIPLWEWDIRTIPSDFTDGRQWPAAQEWREGPQETSAGRPEYVHGRT